MLEAGEGDEHGPLALGAVADDDRDVAGRVVEQRQHPYVLQQALRRVDQHEVDVLLGGEAREIGPGRHRGEGRDPADHPLLAERIAGLSQPFGRSEQLVRSRDG